MNGQIEDIGRLVLEHSSELSRQLRIDTDERGESIDGKGLRYFQIAEAAKYLGVTPGYLRNIDLNGKGPKADTTASGRRLYTAWQIEELREILETNAKSGKRYDPRRREGEHLQVITTINFKGGSSKTTTCIGLAHFLSLYGYRCLCVDVDPQGSLTSMFGIQPEFEIGSNESLYAAIRYDEFRKPLSEVVRKTNFPKVDVLPASLELAEFEYETPKILANREGRGESIFFTRLTESLSDVEDDYDVVLIDCPPQLGYLTMMAVCAATGMLVTVHPQMLDVRSMGQFLRMLGEVLETLRDVGGDMQLDWMRYAITRYDPQDGAQEMVVEFLRKIFGNMVLKAETLKSVAISDAGLTNQSIYEVEKADMTGRTYNRAIASVNAMNEEIKNLIEEAWGRHEMDIGSV